LRLRPVQTKKASIFKPGLDEVVAGRGGAWAERTGCGARPLFLQDLSFMDMVPPEFAHAAGAESTVALVT